ncbi:MAG: YkgJ family cysteine cluster protein [Candidatus Pacebacteria bacterium]|nr:YkgJ family cysteine cluster protein [Candidatus Paceibacterota bacterium]
MINPDNPCFGCHILRNGQEIKAACCHDSIILVTSEEYVRIFLKHYLDQIVDVEEKYTDNEMWFYIYLLGKCPYLTQDGLCSIESTKPLSCKTVQPGEFKYCILPKK